MTTTIPAVFENGVFRPLTPIVLPENHRVNISLEETPPPITDSAIPPGYTYGTYPDPEEDPLPAESDLEYVAVPPESVRVIRATIHYLGERPPMVYPEE